VLAEAQPDAVVWVDKSRRRAIRAPDSGVLLELVSALGSQFNIRLARALRARAAVFVEGDDMKLIRHLALAAGAERVAQEQAIAVIPLGGYSNWDRVEPFAWLVQDLLEGSVETFVILDRDYRSEKEVDRVKARLRRIGVIPHVWRRKELESYLLEPVVISRLLDLSIDDVEAEFAEITATLRQRVTRSCIAQRTERIPHKEVSGIEREVRREVRELWRDPSRRLHHCPPKDVLASFNQRLETRGMKAVTFQRLARSFRGPDVPSEVRVILGKIEGRDL
jgi:hypothetical protein